MFMHIQTKISEADNIITPIIIQGRKSATPRMHIN